MRFTEKTIEKIDTGKLVFPLNFECFFFLLVLNSFSISFLALCFRWFCLSFIVYLAAIHFFNVNI